jgi:hypothetical protein
MREHLIDAAARHQVAPEEQLEAARVRGYFRWSLNQATVTVVARARAAGFSKR